MNLVKLVLLGLTVYLVGCSYFEESTPFAYRTITIKYPNRVETIAGYCAVGVGRYESGGLADVVDCLDNGEHRIHISPHMDYVPSRYTTES